MAYTWQGNDGWWYTSNSGLQYGPYPDQGAASQRGATDSGDSRPAAPAPAPASAPATQPAAAPGVGTAPPAGSGLSAQDQSARATINAFMEQFGLPASLGEWAWSRYLELGEGSEQQIMLELRQRPEYTARFPAMAALSAKGRAISESEYVQYEKDAANIFSYAGLGQFATPAYLTSIIANEVSLDELRDRIYNGYSKVVEAPPEVRQVFSEWFGAGAGDAALAGWFLDAEHTEPFIKDAIETAQAGGYGRFFGFNIDQAYAKLIGDIAQTPQALVSGFQEAIAFKPLTFETISETTDLTEGETVAAAFGTGGSALEEFRKRLESRAAYSRGGGSALMTEEGLVGAGSAGQ